MKTTFTLFTFLTLSLFSLDAQAAFGSKLHLNLFNDGNFVVVVDGIRYTDVRGGLDVHGLRAGTHHIRVVEVFGQRGRQGRHQRGREVLYDGSINIPFRSAVFARLTNNMRLRVTQVQRLPQQGRYRNHPNRGQRGPNYGYGNRGNGYNYNAFHHVKRQMRNTAFDRNKMIIAKQFIRTSQPTSQEVGQLMRLMSFDRSRLQLAKFAYPFVVDQQNFWNVSRQFDFDSSVRELDRFLGNQFNPQPRRRR